MIYLLAHKRARGCIARRNGRVFDPTWMSFLVSEAISNTPFTSERTSTCRSLAIHDDGNCVAWKILVFCRSTNHVKILWISFIEGGHCLHDKYQNRTVTVKKIKGPYVCENHLLPPDSVAFVWAIGMITRSGRR